MPRPSPSTLFIVGTAIIALAAGLYSIGKTSSSRISGPTPHQVSRAVPASSDNIPVSSKKDPERERADSPTNDPDKAAASEQVRRELAAMEPILPGEIENAAGIELIQRWAEMDPAAAIEYAETHIKLHGRAELPAELFITWLDADEKAAMDWVGALPPGRLRSRLAPMVISHCAEQYPHDGLRLALELTGEDRRQALSALFSEWSSSDPKTALAQAMKLPSGNEQNLALRQVVGKWADQDLEAAVEWVKRLPRVADPGSLDIDPGMLESIIEKWTTQAPMEAISHLVSMPEGWNRIQMLGTAAGQWAEQEPEKALSWALGLSKETDRNVMIRGVLSGVAQNNAEAAANMALLIPPGAGQQKGMELVLGQWIASDPSGVANWATSQFQSASSKETLTPIVTAWAESNLESLGQWLNTLPSGNSRDLCCAALTRYLTPTNPELASKWAASISNPSLRR